ncbi:MAG: hypothetical protein V8T45_03575 [Oscillospiraceae bacterium]
MKVSSQDVDVILVGGGSIILPADLAGAKSVTRALRRSQCHRLRHLQGQRHL